MKDARLDRLIALADKTAPEDRSALALELCDLLLNWPMKYPSEMREPFESLLEKAVREVDGPTRRALAERIAAHDEAPVELLNELFFDAPAETKSVIVRRNAQTNGHASEAIGADEAQLIGAARAARGDGFAVDFAKLLGIEPVTAKRILQEPSGEALAVACKGARLTRAAFSALAVLSAPDMAVNDRLAAYDSVPQEGADSMFRYWRNSGGETKAA